MNPKIKFISLGCKVNQAESEALAACCGQTHESDSAGRTTVCIINTCAVTRAAAMQSRQAIRKAIRQNPDAKIVVTGCYAQHEPEVIEQIEGVGIVVGQCDKHRIPEILSSVSVNERKKPEMVFSAVNKVRHFIPMPAASAGSRTRPFLKIQDGCDSFCTYCIVPHTRGRSRSLPAKQVLSEFENLVASGAKEVVLTGIHLGRYGLDLKPETTLLDLLKRLEHHESKTRIRLSSLEPAEITADLIEFVSASGRVCHHFHVPLQSGDAAILKRMNRHYSPEIFESVTRAIKSRMPDAAIGVDVLIGFPGETETAFGSTVDLIQSLPVSYLHVFPFSPRSPAPAADYPDPVPRSIIKKRCRVMHKIGAGKKTDFYSSMMGRRLDIIIESYLDGDCCLLKGLSSNYIPVHLETRGDIGINSRLSCRIIDTSADRPVIGKIEYGYGNSELTLSPQAESGN